MPHMHDPCRERIADRPCFIRPDGGQGPQIPNIILSLEPSGQVLFQLFLEIEPGAFGVRGFLTNPAFLPHAITSFAEDPEAFCSKHLGYIQLKTHIRKPHTRAVASSLTFADLGL